MIASTRREAIMVSMGTDPGPGVIATVTAADTDAIRVEVDPRTRSVSFRPGAAGWRWAWLGTDGEALPATGSGTLTEDVWTSVTVAGWTKAHGAALYIAAASPSDTIEIVTGR